ncbi:serine-type D-Ala-D-Ala carboxypeptidase [Spirochaetia bacterium]|nr:serine-type D-Ala-D-Ala carboxypeptidase [Spirochaetia bacterium]
MLLAACYFLITNITFAQTPLVLTTPPLLLPYLANAPEITSQSAVLIDAETGTALYVKNPHEEIPPASLTKLMTMHLVMNAVAAGRASLDEIVPIGRESWAQSQPPRSSLMFLAPGQIVTLQEIMLGLAVSSGNDAAVAAALRLAPSVRDFAAMMTLEARRMGLFSTRFVEPSGISENNITTAAEFAAFCKEYLRLHPQSLAEFHSVETFAYPRAVNVAEAFRDKPQTIVQANRNALLKTFPGVDGLKTGYIDEAGYNIALTAKREGTRFILVILGAPASPGGDRIRDADGERLLSWAFANFKTVRPIIGEIAAPRLWKGKANTAALKLAEAADFTAPVGRAQSLRLSTAIIDPLVAPLPADYPVGHIILSDEQGEVHRVTLLTAGTYEQGNFFKRLWHSIVLLFRKR